MLNLNSNQYLNEISFTKYQILSTLHYEYYFNDFYFYVNDNLHFTNRFIADILSPKISNMHVTDPTKNYFCIKTTNEDDEDDFDNLVSMILHGSVSISSQHIRFYFDVLKQLENTYALEKFFPFLYGNEKISDSNVIDITLIKHAIGLPIQKEIKYIARHFMEISKLMVEKKLDVSLLELILSSKDLSVVDENWLFSFIYDNYISNPDKDNERIENDIFSLFEYVYFSNVSEINLKKFLQTIDLNNLNQTLWNQLCERIIDGMKKECMRKKHYTKYTFNYDKTGEQRSPGIVSYFLSKNQRNKIFITASSQFSESYKVENLIDYDSSTIYGSLNRQDQWACFRFDDYSVKVKNYAIKSSSFWGENYEHPKSWVLEGSLDGNEWFELSSVNNCNDLNKKGVIQVFDVPNEKESKFIRIRQTGKNWKGNYCLNFESIEFYGDLLIPCKY